MNQRTRTTLITAPLFIAVLLLGSFVFTACVGVLMALCAWELFSMSGQRHRSVWLVPTMLSIALFFLAAGFSPGNAWVQQPAWQSLILLVLIFFLCEVPKRRFLLPDHMLGLSLRAVLLFGVFGAYAVLIRNLPMGLSWMGWLLTLVWASDVAAYAVGSRWGRHPLAPRISPKKTIEGAVGAIVAATLASLVYNALFLHQPLLGMLAYGASASVLGQLGDLHESLTKRWYKVKDSGEIFPGHGGVYDRVDSFLLLTPVTYYFIVFLMQRGL